jgi:segregation and condensation protein B
MDAFEVPISVLRLAEAAVFASPEPLTWQKLQPLLPRDLDPGIVFAALERHCADRGVILVRAGEGWTFRTAPDLGAQLREMMTETRRLPRVVMETLVLIALHQPITRAEIEEIRGVALAQSTIDILLESGLVKPWGRKEVAGRPTLWVTTPRFLSQFGLRSLRDLPSSHLTRTNRAKATDGGPLRANEGDGQSSASTPDLNGDLAAEVK